MKDPAQCVSDLLVAAGVGVFAASTGWSIHVGMMPASPGTVILVNSTGGRTPFPHLLYNEPTVQVVVRGAANGYVAARNKINDVVKFLLGMDSTTVQGDIYRSCNQVGDVSFLGQDDNSRPQFSANFWFIVLPAVEAGGHRVAIT